MSKRHDFSRDAAIWLEYAAADARVAQLAMDKPEKCPPWIACYHAQQAAEKCLKALLIARGREFPLTHDIRHIFDLCEEAGVVWPADVRAAEILVSYAASCRYPSVARELTAKEAGHAVELASLVRRAVEEALPSSYEM